MKIERISENQLRCILTKQDLDDRNIRLSELAYGSEKAKQLFRDMMMIASKECGWKNEENFPLMIEAIPNRENSLVLNITKVEDPEELDTRFSRFTASDELPDSDKAPVIDGADDILDLIRRFAEKKMARAQGEGKAPEGGKNADTAPDKKIKPGRRGNEKAVKAVKISRVFRFETLDDAIAGCHALRGFFKGKSALYRTKKDRDYLLVIHQADHTPEDFNRICNILSEYGTGEPYAPAREAFLGEHGETVIGKNAVEQLASIKG